MSDSSKHTPADNSTEMPQEEAAAVVDSVMDTTASDSAPESPTKTIKKGVIKHKNKGHSTINFDNGRSATAWHVPANISPDEVMEHLNLDDSQMPKALILIAGGAGKMDDNIKAHLIQLFSRGIARTAADIGADIIDGGTYAGSMAMMGRGVADREYRVNLFGAAPAGKVTFPGQADYEQVLQGDEPNKIPLEPNHSHFLLVDADEWGQETDAMYALAKGLAAQVPVISILVNGGSIACQEILRSVRQGWPVIIVSGSGRLADIITELVQEKPDFISDARLSEIVHDGRLYFFPINGTVAELDRLIRRQLRGDTTLRLAWQRFAIYDLNANIHQKTFSKMQWNILLLGVLGTFCALIQTSFADMIVMSELLPDKQINAFSKSAVPIFIQQAVVDFIGHFENFFKGLVDTLRYVIILIPIVITILVAAANRFNAGAKWLVLRGTAEAIKQEIFRYRARAEIYSPDQCGMSMEKKPREVKLAEKLQVLNSQSMQTEISQSALKIYNKVLPPQWSTAPNDDGFTPMTPEQYLAYRLEDQLDYYMCKTNKLDVKLRKLQWMIYIIGGIGTLLAALGLELWIAFTGALVTALGTYLEYQKIEEGLLKYNQAATDLANVRSWWVSLPAVEQEKQANIDYLVGQSERILHNEFSGWAEEMQTTMVELEADKEQNDMDADLESDLSEGKVPPKIKKINTATANIALDDTDPIAEKPENNVLSSGNTISPDNK